MGAAQSSEPLSESQQARELSYLQGLEEEKAAIILFEQKVADQPGSKYLQDSLARARFRQGRYEICLCYLWDLREFLPRSF